MARVAHTTLESEEALREFLEACQKASNSYYFMRWPSHVSGFVTSLSGGSISPEGQLFDGDRELRWRREGAGYSVLLLTTNDAAESLEIQGTTFEVIEGDWDARTRNAHVYPPTETRLPTVIAASGVDISQRYFIDKTTETVHFIALVAGSSSSTSEKKL